MRRLLAVLALLAAGLLLSQAALATAGATRKMRRGSKGAGISDSLPNSRVSPP